MEKQFVILCTFSFLGLSLINAEPTNTLDNATQKELDQVFAAPNDNQQELPPELAELLKNEDFLKELKKGEAELLESKYKQTTQVLRSIQQIVQNLSQIVSNNQLRGIKKDYALAHLQQLQQMVTEVERGPGLIIDLHSLSMLNDLTGHIMNYLHVIMGNGLHDFPDFDVANVLATRAQKYQITPPSLETLDAAIAKNENKILLLQQEERNVGRNFLQRTFKKARTVWNDYNLGSKAFKTALVGVGAYVLFSRINKNWLPETGPLSYLRPVKDQCGDKPQSFVYKDESGKPCFVDNDKDLSALGRIEKLGDDYGLLSLKIGAPLFTLDTLCSPFKDSAQKLWSKTQTKLTNIANTLSGDPAVKSANDYIIEPKYNFDHVIGYENHKKILSRCVEYILDPEKFDRTGATPEKGILFVGPPQTGKTMLAEAFAGEVRRQQKALGKDDEVKFLIYHADLIQMFGISTVLREAERKAPCIVFIDEIDMLGLQRDRDSKMLGDFLTAMSGITDNAASKGVILLAATNKAENLDGALLQHGRFGKILHFEYPSFEERKHYFNKKLCFDLGLMLEEPFIEKMARETELCTFNDLRSIVTTALTEAKVNNSTLEADHLESALDEEVRNIMHQVPALSDDQKLSVAAHQAGQALATVLLDKRADLAKVTIKPIASNIKEEFIIAGAFKGTGEKKDMKTKSRDNINFGGIFVSSKEQGALFTNERDMINDCKIALAGQAAEKILCGYRSSYHAKEDNNKALDLVNNIVFNGKDKARLPKTVQEKLSTQAYELLERCQQEITQFLADHKNVLEVIAQQLAEKQELSGQEVRAIVNPEADSQK